MLNIHAQALGKLAAGHKKTMTPEAFKQRKDAAIRSSKARKGKKRGSKVPNSEHIANNRISDKNKA